jgi:hypothetical protein
MRFIAYKPAGQDPVVIENRVDADYSLGKALNG